MGYTNSISAIKWWDPHTKKLKYCLSAKFDEHNSKFVIEWSSGSETMLSKTISTPPTFKIDL